MIRTTVYWLVDTRLVARKRGWPIGEPFYCGRTTLDPEAAVAAMAYSDTKVAQRVKASGDQICIHIVAEMAPTRDEYVIYRRAVERLRHLNPEGCLNGTIGAPKRAQRIDPTQIERRHIATAKRMMWEKRQRNIQKRKMRNS